MQYNPVNVTANICRTDYIQIPQLNLVIAKYVPEWTNNFKWDESHAKVQEQGLLMPSPKVLTTHFMNVKESADGNRILLDGNGNSISPNELRDLWDYLSSTDRTKFNGKSCWTWLDALFKEENDKWYLHTNHKINLNANGDIIREPNTNSPVLTTQIFDLENCLRKDAYVDLSFNSQGLAKSAFQNDNYSQGNNLYYWHPRNGSVARFIASSSRANLNCFWDPSGSGSALGVLVCAEGATP